MDMKKLMQQAQKMQKDMESKINKIKAKEFVVESNGVKLVMTGDLVIKSLNISESLIGDKESLEDIISIVINDAIVKIEEEKGNVHGQVNQMAKSQVGGMF